MAEVASRARELGARWISLNVRTSNRPARVFYERLGFEDVQIVAAAPVDVLAERASGQAPAGATVGAVIAQTDDQAAIVTDVGRFVPRLFRSQATVVSAPRNGWVSVTDEVWSTSPSWSASWRASCRTSPAQSSSRSRSSAAASCGSPPTSAARCSTSTCPCRAPTGRSRRATLSRSRANPTVLGRLTGAEPAQIRAVARVADSDADLPPAPSSPSSSPASSGSSRRCPSPRRRPTRRRSSSPTELTIVLLHAFPLDERMWEPQIDALEGVDAVAPRLYGRGHSLDRWAAEILDDVGGPLIVVGASMGGYAGLAMAARAPERVRGLLLAGARAAPTPPSGGVTAMR